MKLTIVADYRYVRLNILLYLLSAFLYSLAVMIIGRVGADASLGMASTILFIGTPVALFMMEGQEHWITYRQILPVSRKDVILGRYLSLVIIGIMSTILCIIITLINSAIARFLMKFSIYEMNVYDALGTDWRETLFVSVLIFFCYIVVMSIFTPILMGFGNRIGMIVVFPILLIIWIVLSVSFSYFSLGEKLKSFILNIVTNAINVWGFASVSLGICVVIYLISLSIAVKLYSQRNL